MKPPARFAIAALLVGCASTAPASPDPALCPAGGDVEDVRDAVPAPSGEGWCCPRRHPSFGSIGTSTAGWAADPCECGLRRLRDAPPCVFVPLSDAMGCDAYATDFSCTIPDAGVEDASADGAT